MTENLLLETYLKQLRLPTFLQNYARFAGDAAQSNLSYDRFLLSLVEQEILQRAVNRDERRIKAARFPVIKELADFDFSCVTSPNKAQVLDLARGAYLQKNENIILVGNPGLGKTHLSIGLSLAACRQGRKVRFYNAAALVNDLILAQEKQTLARLMAATLKLQLIVIDELGFIPLTQEGAQLIFQFCSALYERVSLMITTNLRFGDWTQVFHNEQLTAALLDRLTHRSTILEFLGESYRFRQRMQRETQS